MSLLSLAVFIILILISTAKTNATKEMQPPTTMPSIQNFKEYITNSIKEQSLKIQTLLKIIQTNAQSALAKIENMKQDPNSKYFGIIPRSADASRKSTEFDDHQVESPILKRSSEAPVPETLAESRNFNNYHGTSGFGASGNANYGGHVQTYHHHSIGFDPINIVVSVSLISFLLQALQGLLSRTRFPTPIVEGRKLNEVQNWLNRFGVTRIASTKPDYRKRKYPKKYYA